MTCSQVDMSRLKRDPRSDPGPNTRDSPSAIPASVRIRDKREQRLLRHDPYDNQRLLHKKAKDLRFPTVSAAFQAETEYGTQVSKMLAVQ